MTLPAASMSSRRPFRTGWVDWSFVAASAIGGALSGVRPTGTVAVDIALAGAFAALFTLACARARRWSWIVSTALAVVFARSLLVLPALGAELVAVSAVRMDHRSRRVGGLVGAVTVQVLLRLPSFGFHGSTALIAGAAAAPALASGYRNLRPAPRRQVGRVAVAFGALAMGAIGVFAVAVLLARADVEAAVDRSRLALDSARLGDPAAAQADLDAAKASFSDADAILSSWWARPARLVPVVGHQARALAEVTRAGDELSTTAVGTVRTADYERLRYRSGQLDLERMAEMQAPLRQAVAALEDADAALRRSRSPWLLAPVQQRLDQYVDELAGALPDARLAAHAVEVGPGMLGADGPRRYFVAFVTPAELRGSGGLIGNFAELTAVDGRVRLQRSGRVRTLTQAAAPGVRRLRGPADYLARYGRFRPADNFQDLTFSPDFPSTASAIEQLYPQSGGAPVDGVISVDPYALARLLHFTGPITVDGLDEPLTNENAADVLLREQYRLFDDAKAERIDVLEQASRRTFDALTEGSLPEPGRVADQLGPMVRQGRLLMHSTHPDEQRLLERVGLDGALPGPDGDDFLSVVSQNAGNSKIDVFLHRSVQYRAEVDRRSGTMTATARIELRNEAPAAGLPRYVIGNLRGLPFGTNYQSISVYTPHRLAGATVDGEATGFESQREGGHRVHSAFVAIPPGGTAVVELRLEGRFDANSLYALTLASQPTVNPDRVDLTVSEKGSGDRSGSTSLILRADRRWKWPFER